MGDKISKEKFILEKKEFVTPNLIRLFLKSEEVIFSNKYSLGSSCKLLIPPLKIKNIHDVKIFDGSKKWVSEGDEFKPISRTYTLRGYIKSDDIIIIDVANHGLNGPGSRWALESNKGDILCISMKCKKKELCPKTNFIFLASDLTGLPVISTIIESLSSKVNGTVCIEVPSEKDIHKIDTKANLDFKWIVSPFMGKKINLYHLVKNQEFPKKKEGKRFAYVAGESKSIKEIKSFLAKELGWKKDEFYCTSHWKAGKAEENNLEVMAATVTESDIII